MPKHILLENVNIKPSDSMTEIKRMISLRMVDRADPVTLWPEELFIKLIGPLADEETKIVEEEKDNALS